MTIAAGSRHFAGVSGSSRTSFRSPPTTPYPAARPLHDRRVPGRAGRAVHGRLDHPRNEQPTVSAVVARVHRPIQRIHNPQPIRLVDCVFACPPIRNALPAAGLVRNSRQASAGAARIASRTNGVLGGAELPQSRCRGWERTQAAETPVRCGPPIVVIDVRQVEDHHAARCADGGNCLREVLPAYSRDS